MEAVEQIEVALLNDPSVEDCAVRARRTTKSDLEFVAYVVPAGSCSTEELQVRLKSVLSSDLLPSSYVLLSSIPLLPSGLVDEQALASLEVIDADLIQRWQESLRSLPELDRAIVTVEEARERSLALHLSDFLPEWKRAASSSSGSATATRPTSKGPEKQQLKTPAVSHGGSLRETTDLPDTLQTALQRAAVQSPEKGIVYVDEEGSEIFQLYPALLEAAERVLSGVRRRGLKAGDKVILQLNRNEDFVPAFWGCVLGGFIPVPVSIAPSYGEINTTVSKLGNAWELLDHPIVLADEALAPALRSLPDLLHLEGFEVETLDHLKTSEPDRNWHVSRPDDVAILLLTSGSTGTPKAVMQSHRSLLHRSAASAQVNRFTSQDVSLNWFPLNHVGGIVMFHVRDVYSCCQQIQAKTDFILQQPLRWLDLIERHRVTVTWAPNFAFALVNANSEALRSRPWDLSSLRFILNGGEAIVAKTARRFLELLIPFGLPATAMHPAWGMSETSSGVTYSHRFSLTTTTDQDPFVEVGNPIPGVSVRIVDARNHVVEEGTIGSLQIRGTTVTSGYYRNPELNKEVFTEDGWFTTGDLGFLREGRLTITGREKDVVIINGANYYSHEIEAVVEEAEGIETSYTAACAIRDVDTNTDGLAVFFCPLSCENENLRRLVEEIRGRVVRKMGISPDYLIPVEKGQIPKTSIGKIQRAELSQRFAAGDFDAVLKRVDILTCNANTLPDWFYRKIWRPRQAVALLPQVAPGNFLVLLDEQGLGMYLCTELRKLNRACVAVEAGSVFAKIDADRYRIDPRNPDHYRRLLTVLSEGGSRVEQIIHLWSYDKHAGDVANAGDFERFNERGIYSLLYLVQAMHKLQRSGGRVSLHVVGSHTQPISPDDDVVYAKAPIIGLIKSLPQEIPWLHCCHLDLPMDTVEANGARVLRETRVLQRDGEVAYRKGHRLVSRIEKLDLSRAEKKGLPFKFGGMYLVSGGLGGIGLEVGKYLQEHYGARLLLIGRTPLPPRSQWASYQELSDGVSERIRAYLSLERLGDISYEAVDACDAGSLREVVERAQARWNCELDGVIHLAGTYHENMVVEESRDGLEKSLRPKVLGTWALHQLLKGRNDAIFICFSSLVSFFGGATVSAYSAANAFLDTFALCQSFHRSSRYYSFAWSTWEDVGVSRQFRMKHLLQARGYQSMTAKQALYALLAGLQTDQRRLMIGLDGTNRNIRRHIDSLSCRLQQVSASLTTHQGPLPLAKLQTLAVQDRFGTASRCQFVQFRETLATQAGVMDVDQEELVSVDSRTPSRAAAFAAPRTELERRITALWQQILAVPQVSVHDDFFQLGGDSLKAMRFISRLRDTLKVDLTVRTLFEVATVAGLAGELSSQWSEPRQATDNRVETTRADRSGLLRNLENLSDAEVDALLTTKLNERMRKL